MPNALVAKKPLAVGVGLQPNFCVGKVSAHQLNNQFQMVCVLLTRGFYTLLKKKIIHTTMKSFASIQFTSYYIYQQDIAGNIL